MSETMYRYGTEQKTDAERCAEQQKIETNMFTRKLRQQVDVDRKLDPMNEYANCTDASK